MKIDFVLTTVRGDVIHLTQAEARELYETLHTTFGPKVGHYLPYYYVNAPHTAPQRPPYTVWCSTRQGGGGGADGWRAEGSGGK